MSFGRARPQKFRQLKLPGFDRDEVFGRTGSGEVRPEERGNERSGTGELMAEVLAAENLRLALKRVRKNKGSPGSDGMTVEDLPTYLREAWPELRAALRNGSYTPTEVKRVEIPKAGGGVRMLGIPTVLDRFIQQAILQVLQPIFDPTFSDHSYGFRPNRSAHQAVKKAQRYVQEGRRYAVDADLEKFFDRVNHDVLMGRLAKRIGDKTILRLIHRYLKAGILADGVVVRRYEGTPQGGPLSPLLANVLLDEVDKVLERRGHRFVRYADDLNVYVRSKRAGVRVMASLRRLFGGLRLRVNESKSRVDLAVRRSFLGFSFWVTPAGKVKLRVAAKAVDRMKDRVRGLTRRTRGKALTAVIADLSGYLKGWKAYFRLAETPKRFRTWDEWIRHRLRAYQLKQWKRGRTIFRELVARGMSKVASARVAANARRWWHNSRMLIHIALPSRFFAQMGLYSLAT